MAWNAEGFWSPENDDVLTQVDRVTKSSSPLMQQAKGIGTMAASKRGLGNSSIAIGAAQDAVIGKATEIGTANAELINRKNIAQLQGQWDYKKSMEVAALQESGAMARTLASIASAEKISGNELSSREKIALLDREASRDNLKMQLSSDEKLAIINNDAAMQRQIAGDTSAMDRTRYSEDAATGRLTVQEAGEDRRQLVSETGANTRTGIQEAGANYRATQSESGANQRAQLQADTTVSVSDKDRLANRANAELQASTTLTANEMDNATTRQNAMLQATATVQAAHLNTVAAIMSNEDIPAAAREEYTRNAQAVTEANIGTIEQITGTDLAWGNNTRANTSLPPGNTGTATTQGDGLQRVDAPDGTYYLKEPGKTSWAKWQGNTYLGEWQAPA